MVLTAIGSFLCLRPSFHAPAGMLARLLGRLSPLSFNVLLMSLMLSKCTLFATPSILEPRWLSINDMLIASLSSCHKMLYWFDVFNV